jgi:hypothetical protein
MRRIPGALARPDVTGGDEMFVLGLLILAAAAVAAVELIVANRAPINLHMWNWTWHLDAFWLAVAGAVIITAAWLALGMMRLGFGHSRKIRRERKQLAAENRALAERAAKSGATPARTHAPAAAPLAAQSNGGTGQHAAPVAGQQPNTADGERRGLFGRHATSGGQRS